MAIATHLDYVGRNDIIKVIAQTSLKSLGDQTARLTIFFLKPTYKSI